jgi:hypothetical protein
MTTASGKPKGSRGAGSGLRMKLKWAIFCKSVSQEPDTKETSLIGVLPGLSVQIQTLPAAEKGPFNLPIPIWAHAVFVLESPPPERTEEQIEVIFTLGKQSFPNSIPLELKPGETLAILNVRLLTPTGFPVTAGSQTLSLTFKHNGHELGKAELPITVTVTTVNKLG